MGVTTFIFSVIGTILNYRVQSNNPKNTLIHNNISDEDIETITLRTIQSDHFISTLKTTLPQSNKSEESSAHIPFILSAIQSRMISFKKALKYSFSHFYFL